MFGRRISHDGEVVAAARRRLAALALRDGPDSRQGDPREGPTEIESTEGDRSLTPVRSLPTAARHRGEPRTELGRWGVTAQHLTVMALCLLLLVIVVAWWALRSVPHADQMNLTSNRQLPAAATSEGPPSTPTSSPVEVGTSGSMIGTATAGAALLVIDVAGKVRRPGIVELAPGSRVVDAIAAAGGALPGVSLTSVNLARLLVDGEQIAIGIRIPGYGGSAPTVGTGSGASTPPAIARVQLNTATLDQLDTLPGVGPVTAQAILQWRADNGPFTAVDELLEISGIGDATLADIRPYVYV